MPVQPDERMNPIQPNVRFTGPWRYVVWMAVFTAAVLVLAIVLHAQLIEAFDANPAINGVILAVLVIGVIYTFAQALGIGPAAD